MKTNMSKLFSLSATDSEYFNDNQNKIEIVSCPAKEMKCKEHLLVINKNYHESDMHVIEKDFQRSIEKLQNAYYKSMELTDAPCVQCSKFFRSNITDSLKGIKKELEKMTTGLFAKKHYLPSYRLVSNVLQDLEKLDLYSTVHQNKSKEQFLGSYLKKRVS